MSFRAPENVKKLSTEYITGDLSSNAELHRVKWLVKESALYMDETGITDEL
jgi:hypothetical protein